MIIKNISFENFRQFKNAKFDFSTDPEKKITIIIGNNTFGKTTIVRAFLWCLYRKNDFDDQIVLNSDVYDEMRYGSGYKDVKVIIELSHNNYSYKITTSQKFIIKDTGKLFAEKPTTSMLKMDSTDSSHLVGDRAIKEIDDILSEDLKEFFFYDGENNKIENITNSKKNLKSAITKITGIEKLISLQEYYNDKGNSTSVISKLKDELVVSDDFQIIQLKDRLDEYQRQLESKKELVDTLTSEIETLNIQLDNEEAQIKGNEDVLDLQNQKQQYQKDIITYRSNLTNNMSKMINTFNSSDSFLKTLFAYNFKDNDLTKEMSEASFTSNKSFKFIDEKAIDQFIEMGECVCGTKIILGSPIHSKLVENKMHMEPHDYGRYASDFISVEENNIQFCSNSLENIKAACGDLLDTIESLDNSKDSLENIKKKLDGRVDVGAHQQQARQYENQITAKTAQIDYILKTEIPFIESNIEKTKNKIDLLKVDCSENDFIQRCIDYAANIQTNLKNSIERHQNQARSELERITDNIFQEMYSSVDSRKIRINDEFQASCDLISGKKLDKSTGLKTVQNYAFVAGIMQLIREKIVDDIEDDDKDVDYPLIMDAPFSSTDDVHITNICKTLPKYTNQIIIAVMEKDFKNSLDQIRDNIGRMYRIEKQTESDSTVLEVKNV